MQALFPKKTENLGKICNIPQTVMIKGFMGEPARLKAEIIDNLFVTVAGKSGKTKIKLKVKYVYCYDEKIYQKLQEAFNLNDTETLAQEWQQAKPINALN